jgi:hypothetical protein
VHFFTSADLASGLTTERGSFVGKNTKLLLTEFCLGIPRKSLCLSFGTLMDNSYQKTTVRALTSREEGRRSSGVSRMRSLSLYFHG